MSPEPGSTILTVLTEDEEGTREAGRRLASLLSPGDLVLLEGDLGSGKTVFVRGLAGGVGADPGEVASPTFALVHEYGPAAEPARLAHADLYRLEDEASRRTLAELGLEELRAQGAVLAIEWPRPPWSSESAWRVTLEDLGSGRRRITVTPPAAEPA